MIEILQDRCSRDGICTQVCPPRCFRLTEEGIRIQHEEYCIQCGHCVAACPHDAIVLNGMDGSMLPRAGSGAEPAPLMALIKSRRSIREFKDKPVPRDLLKKALNTVKYAPTAKNAQGVSWVVLEGKKTLRNVANLVVDAMRGNRELTAVVLSHDAGLDPIFRGAPCAVFACSQETKPMPAVNCCIAAASLDLLLTSMGLGTCWAGYVMGTALHSPAIAEAMGLKPATLPYAGLMVGWPRVNYTRVPERDEVAVHWISDEQ